VFTPWTPDGYLVGVSEGSLSLNHKRCQAAKASVPLTARGLTGGPISPFGDDYDCTPTSRVLVRLQATFRARASLRVTRWDERRYRESEPVRSG
jgi:hypothetical protein